MTLEHEREWNMNETPVALPIACPQCNGEAAVFLCRKKPYVRIGHGSPACKEMLTETDTLSRRFLHALNERQALALERWLTARGWTVKR